MIYFGFNFNTAEPAGIAKLITIRLWLKDIAGDIAADTWFWVKEDVNNDIKGSIPDAGIVIKDPHVATMFGIMYGNDLV